MTEEFWILIAACIVPCAALIGLLQGRSWWLARKKLRVPVADKLLRAPGESLRKKLEALEDDLSSEFALVFVLPLAYTSLIFAQQHGPKPAFGPTGIGILAAVGVIGYGVICRRLWRILNRRQRYRLGLGGERAVGEELHRLLREGCHVFHDVPAPYGNVDHVLVTPAGVYAIETKTRRKREAGKDTHKVIFDGNRLRFPTLQPDGRCLEQATQQAARLSDWLSKAVGTPVHAQPVLALPGWFVDRKGRGNVRVLSGKEIHHLARGRALLDASLIARIVHQLDQRCRDVEF